LEEGYILVFQDVRGRYMSEGEYVDLRPFIADKHSPEQIDEASDAYDTIDFLVREVAGNNGRVGVYGNSYPGFYALMAAASGHPALKAASPQAPVTDWFMGDDTHHNGVLFLRDAFSFIGGSFGRPMDNPTTEAAAAPRYVRTDEYDFFLRKATVDSLTQLLGDTVRFWNDMMRHPDYDDWWRERCSVRAMHDLRPAILVVGGLFDAEDCYGAWTTYASIRRQSPRTSCRMVAGPWVHGGWRSSNGGNRLGKMRFGDASLTDYYQRRIEVPFFNYYLLGKGDGGELAGATIFFTGENRWRTFEEWPPADARKEVLFLRSNGALSAERPIERESFSGYRSDPASPVPYDFPMRASRDKAYMVADQRFAAGRPDVLCFTTEPLAGDVTFAGGIRAVLQGGDLRRPMPISWSSSSTSGPIIRSIRVTRCSCAGTSCADVTAAVFQPPNPSRRASRPKWPSRCPISRIPSAKGTGSWCRCRARGFRWPTVTPNSSSTFTAARPPTSFPATCVFTTTAAVPHGWRCSVCDKAGPAESATVFPPRIFSCLRPLTARFSRGST